MAKNAVFGGVHHLKLSVFLRGGSMKSLPQLWQIRSFLCASTKAIVSLYNNRLSANVFSNPIPKTIDHMIPKVGGATLELGDLNNMVIK